jgi:hypothetical protein
MQQSLLVDVSVRSRDSAAGDAVGLPLDAPLQSKPWFLERQLVHHGGDLVTEQDT